MPADHETRVSSHATPRRSLPIVLFVALVAVALLGAVALWQRPATATAQVCRPNGADTGINPGQCAPDFALPDAQGHAVNLAGFRGHPVLLHFWGVPCTSCAAEYADFARAVKVYGPKGVAVLDVESWGSDMAIVQAWQKAHHLAAHILVDPAAGVPTRYGVTGTPTTIYVDKSGKIVASVAAIESYADFARHLNALL